MKSSIINKANNKFQCSLHLQEFTLYCDRCLELVCQKCSFIGPHNTPIHSLTSIHQAYQRRFQQINIRLSKLTQTRNRALTKISELNNQIEAHTLNIKKESTQNDKQRIEIEERLKKSFENTLSNLRTQEQLIDEQLNRINDLGHEFQTLSQASNIDCLINYERVMEQLKQVVDQFEILLEKYETPHSIQLPKQLSGMRIKLNQISTLDELFQKKIKIIQQLIKKLNEEIKKIETPKIDYQTKLKEINYLLQSYQEKKGQFSSSLESPTERKTHFVCHFCGIILDDFTINTLCQKNQISQQMKSTQGYYNSYKSGANLAEKLNGYCKNIPEIGKFGTHRHFFGEPINYNLFFRTSYLGMMLGNNVLSFLISFLPEEDESLRTINQNTKVENNSFFNYLSLLFLKVCALGKIKGKDIQKLFKNEDIKNEQKQTGYCEAVAMQYILMEILGLKEFETAIIVDICKLPVTQFSELKQKRKQSIRNYQLFISKLKQIKI